MDVEIPVSQFPISVIAIVRVCFLNSSEVGLADSLGKNWEIEWKQFRSAREAPLQAKMTTRKEPALCNLLINSKGYSLLIFPVYPYGFDRCKSFFRR